MNIAFISYWSCPLTKLGILDSGGMSVYLLNLANELGNLGHKVDIFTRLHNRPDVPELIVQKGVKVIHLPQKEKDLYQDTNHFAQEIINYRKSHKTTYDIVHSHYFYSGLAALQLQKKYPIPHVFTFHSLGKYERKDSPRNTEKRIEAEKFIVKNADGIIVSTKSELDSIVKDYQGKKHIIHIVSPGVDHHIFKKIPKTKARKIVGIPANLKLILFIGRIDPNKGINILLKAVSILTEVHASFSNNYQVLLIGGDTKSNAFWENKEVLRLRKLIEDKKLSCCVKFVGTKFHSELSKYYCASDLLVLPSFHESFGLVALEAMASGTAVVASKVGGLSYLITDGETGRFFKAGDPADLSEKIWELLNDNSQRLNIEKNAIIESQKYCWAKQAKKAVNIYRKLVST